MAQCPPSGQLERHSPAPSGLLPLGLLQSWVRQGGHCKAEGGREGVWEMRVGPRDELQLGRAATGPRAHLGRERATHTPGLQRPPVVKGSKQTWAVRQEGPINKTWSVGKQGVGQLRSRVAGATCQRTALPGHPGSKMQAVASLPLNPASGNHKSDLFFMSLVSFLSFLSITDLRDCVSSWCTA